MFTNRTGETVKQARSSSALRNHYTWMGAYICTRPTLPLAKQPTNAPLHVIAPPWYDAVDAVPSGAHVNGLLGPLE